MADDRVLKALIVTLESLSQSVSDLTVAQMVEDLSVYPAEHVLRALKRVRLECRKCTLADIIDRLPGGHPGPEEAWGICSRSLNDEAVSLVWTDEMAEAMGAANALRDDPIGARMAFKEVYGRLIAEARASQRPPHWRASLGWDPVGREAAQVEAAAKNGQRLGLSSPTVALPEPVKALTDSIGKAMPDA